MDPKRLKLSEVDLQHIVAKHFAYCEETRDWTNWHVIGARLDTFGSCPEGFLADHYELKVTVEAIMAQIIELSFFVKCSPINNPALARYIKEIGSFHKEIHVLKEIVSAIQHFCPWRTIAPTVYCVKEFNLLVMNNVKSHDFFVPKKESGLLDYTFLCQALETLACLHAGSFVVEYKLGKSLAQLFPNVLDENAWVTTPKSTRLQDVSNVIKLYMEVIQKCDKWQGSQKDSISAQLPELFRKIYDYTVPSTKFRNCLNHGDLWCNNIMFKCSDQGKPTECILVDYQMSRYVPPAYDINLLLYLTSSRQLRNEQRSTLLTHYYACFSEVLQRNQLDSAVILPYNTFLESCEQYKLAGLIHSTMISVEVTLPRVYLEEVFNMPELAAGFMPESKVRVCVKAFFENTNYRNHLIELMEELFSHITTPF